MHVIPLHMASFEDIILTAYLYVEVLAHIMLQTDSKTSLDNMIGLLVLRSQQIKIIAGSCAALILYTVAWCWRYREIKLHVYGKRERSCD